VALTAGDAARAVHLMRTHLDSLSGQLQLEDEEPAADLAAIFGRRRT